MFECIPIGKIAAHSAYEMFSWYKYLIVSFFSHLGFWSGNLFLIGQGHLNIILIILCCVRVPDASHRVSLKSVYRFLRRRVLKVFVEDISEHI